MESRRSQTDQCRTIDVDTVYTFLSFTFHIAFYSGPRNEHIQLNSFIYFALCEFIMLEETQHVMDYIKTDQVILMKLVNVDESKRCMLKRANS